MATPLNSSLLRGFEILSLFSRVQPEISATNVVDVLGLNQATAHRFLLTLEKAGAIKSTKRGYYALGEKIEELGQISKESGAITILIQPALEALCRSLDESVMVCRLSKSGPTCVAVANSTQPISVNIAVGTVLPFHASAQGKLWLADMEKAKRTKYLEYSAIATSSTNLKNMKSVNKELKKISMNGYATNLGDNEPDIAAVAVPVRRPKGEMALSLSTFGLLRRFDTKFIEKAKDELSEAAKHIEEKYW